MNILIVDDNKNNRMMIKFLLEDYMEEHEGIKFFLDEAEDGQVAINKCAVKDYDMVFMDIEMPNIDGIQATKIIRKYKKKLMIIAVSAVDDAEHQKLILSNGAEDYISKPINSDIFVSRMENYITLCEARRTKKTSSQICANLFTKNIYSRHTRFIITSEDSLSEFWEYYLLSDDEKCDDLSDVVRTVFALGEIQVKLKVNADIFVEESEDKKYFTLSHVNEIPRTLLNITLKKNNFSGDYKIENEKISFKLDMIYSHTDEVQEDVRLAKEDTIVPDITESKSLEIQDYIDNDDLYDLEEYGNKLNSIMLIVGSGGVTVEEVSDIYIYLEKLGSILSTYSEVYSISKALVQLSVDMQNNIEGFIDNSEALGPLCKAFSNDMSNWIELSFHTGAPSASFMNDTIVVNSQTIGGMLTMNEAPLDGTDNFDDIFDF